MLAAPDAGPGTERTDQRCPSHTQVSLIPVSLPSPPPNSTTRPVAVSNTMLAPLRADGPIPPRWAQLFPSKVHVSARNVLPTPSALVPVDIPVPATPESAPVRPPN